MSELWISRFQPPRADSPNSCVVCGCRLAPAGDGADAGWRHLPSLEPGLDARGDRPFCVDLIHDSYGYGIEAEVGSAA